jgi:hypothetical protein
MRRRRIDFARRKNDVEVSGAVRACGLHSGAMHLREYVAGLRLGLATGGSLLHAVSYDALQRAAWLTGR